MDRPPETIPPESTRNDQLNSNLWKKRFDKKSVSHNPVIAKLDIEYNELVQTCKRFQEVLLPQDRVDFQERPQTAKDVVGVVRNAQTTWVASPRQRVFSRSMTLCDSLLSSIDSHSDLRTALSGSDMYLSLFYGVLQSIIKASASYPRIMEGLVKALIEINESIRLPVGEKQRSLTFDAIAPVASHNLDVYNDFHDLLCNIRHSAQTITRQITDAMDLDEPECVMRDKSTQGFRLKCLWEKARLSQVGLQGRDRRSASENTITRQLIWEIQRDQVERQRLKEERTILLSNLLGSVGDKLSPVEEQSSGIVCMMTAAAGDLDSPRIEWSNCSKRKLTRTELQLASKNLQAFFDSDDQIADLDPEMEIFAEGSVLSSLRQWIECPLSQVLAVGGFQSTAFPSPVALISACYVNFARQARLPVISHFCSLQRQASEKVTLFEQGLIALSYSLIRQLIDLLPPVLDCDAACDFSAERFHRFDGTLKSWKEVLSLIDMLLDFAPPLVVCVVDGLDIIHDSSTDHHIRSLIRVLLKHTRQATNANTDSSQKQNVLMKVLFTVAGRPSSLVETLSENQLILSESNKTDQPDTTDQVLASDVGPVMMNACV